VSEKKKIDPKAPKTSVKADETKAEQERTSQRLSSKVFQRISARVNI
jgi:hypothetical protein